MATLARLKSDARAMAGHSERRERAERDIRGFMADNPPPTDPYREFGRELAKHEDRRHR